MTRSLSEFTIKTEGMMAFSRIGEGKKKEAGNFHWPIFIGVFFLLIFPSPGLIASFNLDGAENGGEHDLHPILKHTGEYCRKLSGAAMDFICMEEIEESYVDVYLEWIPMAGARMARERRSPKKHKYIYDYQFVRKGEFRVEKRDLLEEDGKKPDKEVKYLKNRMFMFKNVLFGPINLLALDRQMLFDYGIEGNVRFEEKSALIISAVPKPSSDAERLWGKIWIDESDFSILKIEWGSGSYDQYGRIQETAKEYDGDPRIIQVTEFGYEKNGIRFPSRYYIEEAYITKKGKKIIHSETEVLYRDYKFFTVETEVSIKKERAGLFFCKPVVLELRDSAIRSGRTWSFENGPCWSYHRR